MSAAHGVSREPLLNRAALTALVGLVVAILALVGVHVTNVVSGQVVDVLLVVLPVAGPLLTAVLVRPKVTPVASPRDNEGRHLVAVEDLDKLVQDAAGALLAGRKSPAPPEARPAGPGSG